MSLLNCTFFSYPLGRGKVGEKTMSVSRIFYLYTNFLKKGVCVFVCVCEMMRAGWGRVRGTGSEDVTNSTPKSCKEVTH